MSVRTKGKEQLERLYAQHAISVFSLASRICGQERAVAVTRETFLAVWRESIDGGRALDGCSAARLHTTARSLALAHRDPRTPPEAAEPAREVAAEREALELAYFGGLKVEQIAERLGVQPSRVHHLLNSGLRREAAATTPR